MGMLMGTQSRSPCGAARSRPKRRGDREHQHPFGPAPLGQEVPLIGPGGPPISFSSFLPGLSVFALEKLTWWHET